VAIEVIEHIANFWHELRAIERVLQKRGIAVFTTLLTNDFVMQDNAREVFDTWWYKDDPTHLGFFCNHSLAKLAELGPYDIDVIGNQAFVLAREGVFAARHAV